MSVIPYYFYRLFIDPLLYGIHKMINNLITPDSLVIDIGCGTGELVFSLAVQSKRVIGIDRNEKILEYAERKRNRLKIDNISFLVQDINEGRLFTETEQCFDYAIFSMFLHQISINEAHKIIDSVKDKAKYIILADFTYPVPKNLAGQAVKTIERIAGGDHYLNFKEYQRLGGLDYFLKEHKLIITDEQIGVAGTIRVLKVLNSKLELSTV